MRDLRGAGHQWQGTAAERLDRATFERSLTSEQLGLRHDGVGLLIDAEGVLRAWSFRLAPLLPEIEELLAAPPAAAPRAKRRRAI